MTASPQQPATLTLGSWWRVLAEPTAGESRLLSLIYTYLGDALDLSIIGERLYSCTMTAVNKGGISAPCRRGLILDKLGNVSLPAWRQVFLVFSLPPHTQWSGLLKMTAEHKEETSTDSALPENDNTNFKMKRGGAKISKGQFKEILDHVCLDVGG